MARPFSRLAREKVFSKRSTNLWLRALAASSTFPSTPVAAATTTTAKACVRQERTWTPIRGASRNFFISPPKSIHLEDCKTSSSPQQPVCLLVNGAPRRTINLTTWVHWQRVACHAPAGCPTVGGRTCPSSASTSFVPHRAILIVKLHNGQNQTSAIGNS